jgi:hypothetical protein
MFPEEINFGTVSLCNYTELTIIMILIAGFVNANKLIMTAYFVIVNGDNCNTKVVVGIIYHVI